MKLVDAHIHLSDVEYNGHLDDLIMDAKNAGVVALISNSMDLQSCLSDIGLALKYPDLVYAAVGIHPWNVNVLKENELQETIDLVHQQKGNVKAIGEIGLDYKYESIWEKQISVFDQMLHLAEKTELPVIIHSRGTTEKILEMLPSYRLKRVLLHWFSHPISALSKVIDNNYFITEGPPVTYSNGIREVVEKTPLTNLLTETDGPVAYWKQPFKGQLTKPSFIGNVVSAIAEIKKIPAVTAAEQILNNFEDFFKITLV